MRLAIRWYSARAIEGRVWFLPIRINRRTVRLGMTVAEPKPRSEVVSIDDVDLVVFWLATSEWIDTSTHKGGSQLRLA